MITPYRDIPQVIGSNLHISSGAAEIADCRWDGNTYTITLTDAGARNGTLFIRTPKPLTLDTSSGCAASIEQDNENIMRLNIAERIRGSEQHICLRIDT